MAPTTRVRPPLDPVRASLAVMETLDPSHHAALAASVMGIDWMTCFLGSSEGPSRSAHGATMGRTSPKRWRTELLAGERRPDAF